MKQWYKKFVAVVVFVLLLGIFPLVNVSYASLIMEPEIEPPPPANFGTVTYTVYHNVSGVPYTPDTNGDILFPELNGTVTIDVYLPEYRVVRLFALDGQEIFGDKGVPVEGVVHVQFQAEIDDMNSNYVLRTGRPIDFSDYDYGYYEDYYYEHEVYIIGNKPIVSGFVKINFHHSIMFPAPYVHWYNQNLRQTVTGDTYGFLELGFDSMGVAKVPAGSYDAQLTYFNSEYEAEYEDYESATHKRDIPAFTVTAGEVKTFDYYLGQSVQLTVNTSASANLEGVILAALRLDGYNEYDSGLPEVYFAGVLNADGVVHISELPAGKWMLMPWYPYPFTDIQYPFGFLSYVEVTGIGTAPRSDAKTATLFSKNTTTGFNIEDLVRFAKDSSAFGLAETEKPQVLQKMMALMLPQSFIMSPPTIAAASGEGDYYETY